jgi:uncharacterized protein (TIGR00661 family)
MRIVYGVVTTGMGHLSRTLALLPLFEAGNHELLLVTSGPGEIPSFVSNALGRVRIERYTGLEMIEDGQGGISKRETLKLFTARLPGLLDELRRAHRTVTAFAPDLIVSDFDPITASPFVSPGVPKIGIGNHPAQRLPSAEQVPGQTLQRWKIDFVYKLFTVGLDHEVGCHFYPIDDACLPPILRPEILSVTPSNRGHVVVYHSFARFFGPIREFALRHPDVPIFAYGYTTPPPFPPENVVFESDDTRFVDDLATCDAFVGTAGFQSISEAIYLGKKVAIQPIEGHYEQAWNADQVERHGLGRQIRGCLDEALDQSVDPDLHERLAAWYRDGARLAYERLVSFAPDRGRTRRPALTAMR